MPKYPKGWPLRYPYYFPKKESNQETAKENPQREVEGESRETAEPVPFYENETGQKSEAGE